MAVATRGAAPVSVHGAPDVDEDAIYAAIAEELKSGNTDQGLWTRLFAKCDGDEIKTKVAYINQRAEKLLAAAREEIRSANEEMENAAAAENAKRAAESEQERLKLVAEERKRLKENQHRDEMRDQISLLRQNQEPNLSVCTRLIEGLGGRVIGLGNEVRVTLEGKVTHHPATNLKEWILHEIAPAFESRLQQDASGYPEIDRDKKQGAGAAQAAALPMVASRVG
jgi:hypothetical protein